MAKARSPALPASEFPAQLEEGVPHVVVLAGAERWFREEGVRLVVRRVLPEGDPGGAYLRVDARRPEDRSDVSAAIDELRSTSLFGGGKVVAIDNADAAEGPWAKGKTSPLLHLARAALQVPSTGSALVLLTAKPVKGKSAAPTASLVKAGALVVDCRALYDAPASWQRGRLAHDHELAHFLVRRMERVHEKRLGLADAHAITRLVGTDLGRLDASLETLRSYAGDRPQVGARDVHAALGLTRHDPAWKLAEAVADGDAVRAFELLEAALDRGVPDGRGALVSAPEALFGFLGAALHGTWRRLLAGAEGLARGEDGAEVARAAGVPPFRAEAFLRQCQQRPPDDLLARHAAFLEAEMGVKGGRAPPRLALERLVARLTAPVPRRQ